MACEHLIRIEEPPLPLVYSQNPACSVKLADADGGAVRESRVGANSCTCRYPVAFPGRYSKLSRALFLVLNRSWGNPITARHTLHSGDCGWRRSEISIASAVQAVSLQRPSWTAGLVCLYYALPSYDLIWLNVWLREEDGPKPQLGILFAPRLCVLLWLNPLRGDERRCVFAVLKLYSTIIWGLLQHGNEIRTDQIVYPFWHRWKESTLRTPPLPQILLGDLFILPIPFYKFMATLHRKESFPFPPTIHFSHISVKTNAVFFAEKDPLLH